MEPNRRTRRTAPTAALALALSALGAFAVAPAVGLAEDLSPADVAEARAAFGKARAGDGAAAERAVELYHRLAAQDPQNPVYLAYEGAAWTLRGRDAWWPFTKLERVEHGLDLLDEALARLGPAHDAAAGGLAPSLETRLVAATTFAALPRMFHRAAQGRSVAAAALASPAVAQAPAPVRDELGRLAASPVAP